MSVSEFIQSMVEAGIKTDKGFEIGTEDDQTIQELHEQRNDLRNELLHYRNRVEKLEDQLYHDEVKAIKDYVRNNPGCTYADLVQHMIDTVPERVITHIEMVEGDAIVVSNGQYYPTGPNVEGDQDG